MTTKFIDPNNANKEYYASNMSWLWTILFGPLFFLYKGMWLHFIIFLPISIATFGFASLLVALFANKMVYNFYIKKGYNEVDS